MMKDTQQGQTNHCPMCEDAAKKIAELESQLEETSTFALGLNEAVNILRSKNDELQALNAQLMGALKTTSCGCKCSTHGYNCGVDEATCHLEKQCERCKTLSANPNTDEWLNKKHVEWLGKPVGKFIRHDYAGWQQLHKDFEQDKDGVALYAMPKNKE